MSKIDFKSAAVGALAVAVTALAIGVARKPAEAPRNDDALIAKINAEVRGAVAQGIKENPRLLVDTIQGYMQAEQERQLRERDSAAISRKAEIASSNNHPIVGNPKGTVEIVYFFDANCAYCKRMDPVLKKVIEENPDVRVVHKEIPILGETSRLAAQISNIVWQLRPEKYRELHERFLAHNGALAAEQIEDYLRLVLPSDEAEAILHQATLRDGHEVAIANAQIKGNLKLAEEAGITGTPFVFFPRVDGIIRGAGENAYEEVTKLVVKSRDATK